MSLHITIMGGIQSGKSRIARLLAAALRKDGLYTATITDHDNTLDAQGSGPVEVSIETLLNDAALHTLTVTSTEHIQISKGGLKLAFLAWEAERRAGKCLPLEDADRLPPGQVAQGSADKLWGLLKGPLA